MEWSKEQQAVIESVNDNTLVAASAGSGKTAVMIERLNRLICGEKKQDIKRIMLVTFTLEVAAELKTKIARMLKQKIQKNEGDVARLVMQMDSLPMCEISTLHAMCSNLIKRNFEVVDIDPSFSIIEEESSRLLFANAVDEVLEEYEFVLNKQLLTLTKYFGSRRELLGKIQKLYSFVMAQKDRQYFLNKIAIYCCQKDINNNRLVIDYVEEVNNVINLALAHIREFELSFIFNKMNKHIDFVRDIQGYFKGYEYFSNFEEMLMFFKRDFGFSSTPRKNCYKDDVCEAIAFEFKIFYDSFKEDFEEWLTLAKLDILVYGKEAEGQKEYVLFLCEVINKSIEKYSKAKRDENKMDFNDLEYYAVKILENDEVAQEIRESFDYVAIDEYQDTNDVQEYIIGRVSNGHNLFMVGDSKQSIYQFRMTDPTIFLNKYKDFNANRQEGKAFSLNMNYRSSDEVLQFVNNIFDKLMTKQFGGINYAVESRLGFGSQGYIKTIDEPIKIARFDKSESDIELNLPTDNIYSVREDCGSAQQDDLSEALYIAEQISLLVGIENICELDKDQKPILRKIRYDDIAILCQSRSPRVGVILDYLQSLNIPVDSSNLLPKTKNQSVSLIIDFLAVVDNPCQDYPLINVMSSPIGGFSLTDLAEIKSLYNGKYFFESVKFATDNKNHLQAKCMAFTELLKDYRQFSFCLSVAEIAEKIIIESDLDQFLLSQDGGNEKLQQLLTFVKNLRNKNYNNSLPIFLAVVEKLDGINEVDTVAVGQENSIKTNTIHACKGLEYPIVFLIDTAHQFNNQDTKEKIIFDKEFGILLRTINEEDGLYGTGLLWKLLVRRKAKKDKEERMRLLYVALTRAKNMLFITATKKRSKSENSRDFEKGNSFFDWIYAVCCGDKKFEIKYYSEPKFEKTDFELQVKPLRKFCKPNQKILDGLDSLQQKKYAYDLSTRLGIKYTVTEINNSVTEDMQYEPSVMNPSLQFAKGCKSEDVGTAYHKVLECIDLSLRNLNDISYAIDKMVADNELKVEQRKMISDKIIFECLNNEIFDIACKNQCLREKEFMLYLPAHEIVDVEVDDKVLLQGTIDMLIIGAQNILVDFKLSEQTSTYVKKKYLKQLQLYELAVESCLGIKVDKKFIFIIGRNEIIQL